MFEPQWDETDGRPSMSYVLDPTTIGAYLAKRGLLADDRVEADFLAGGVSNDVVMVRAGEIELVVKQALPRLRVEEEWLASQDRIVTEGTALAVAGSIRLDSVPAVIDIVPEDFLLVMQRAPRGFSVWKEDLLAGRIDVGVAERVGYLIGSWHSATYDDDATRKRFDDLEAFIQLRIDPYFRTVAIRHEDLAERIEELAESLISTRRCLVHGDLSPKNILVGGTRAWVIDWEVAHFGNPTFDLAFVLCHLRCKAAHRPGDAGNYRRCATAFLDAYRAAAPEVISGIAHSYLVAQTGCLLLARMDGKSTVEYLSEQNRISCRQLARHLISGNDLELNEIWSI